MRSHGSHACEYIKPDFLLTGVRSDDDPYHVATVRSPLTRNLASRFSDVVDEITESFKDYVPLTKDWNSVSTYETMTHIVCRTSNRYFIGLPLSWCANTIPKTVKRALEYLGPTIKGRLSQEHEEEMEWVERPNDLITWLLGNTTQAHHRTVHDLVIRILVINFGAIHTTTAALTHALYDLAIRPEYVEPMCQEVEGVIEYEGWTKAAMQKMRKIDSFLKESQRLNHLGGFIMGRKVLKNWTLSDGTLIPAGTLLDMAGDAMNKDERTFPKARTFRGFRFTELRDGDGGYDSIKHQMVTISPDQIVFGYGRHACPGRFFAVNEIKAIFAHIILQYDVQLEGGSLARPENFCFGQTVAPNLKAKVMFRKRHT